MGSNCPLCRRPLEAGTDACPHCAKSAAGAPKVPPPPGMVLVPEGEFLLGDERRRLWISGFFIDLAPVTHREYATFLASTGHPPPEYWRQGEYPPERADHPVVAVSIDDARAFARWRGMAIPTEEEWEKAARGSDGRVYPWGDLFSSERANVRGAGIRDTTPVGRFPSGKSPYGCVDMVGNVWEWTETPHDVSGKFLTLKGGSWYDVSSYARCTTRFSARPDYRGSCVGFRCVKRIGGVLPRIRVTGPPETRKLDRRDILAAAAPSAAGPAGAAPASGSSPAELGAALRIFDYGEENVLREKLDRDYREAAAAFEAGRAASARQALLAILEQDARHPSAIDLLAKIPPDAADRALPPATRGWRDRAREALATPRGRARALAAAGLLLALVAFVALPGSSGEDGAEEESDVPARSRHATPRDSDGPDRGSEPAPRPHRSDAETPPPKKSRGSTASAPPGMVEVEAAEFPFGSERTMTRVERFFIDRLEVTNEDYMRFVRAASHPAPLHWIDGRIPEGQESHPVTFVAYADATAYAKWAGKRLPTEEEWELAAAGPEGLPYPWGREFEPGRANIMLSLDDIMSAPGLQAVASFSTGVSPCGAEDMVGNVLEWTSSWFDPESRRVRVLKGGAWSLGREDGRISARYGFFSPETRNEVIGFRCAQD